MNEYCLNQGELLSVIMMPQLSVHFFKLSVHFRLLIVKKCASI